MTRSIRHLDLDPVAFAAAFDRHPVRLRHHLVGHDLFRLDRLAELADWLPAGQVDHNLGALPSVLAEDTAITSLDLGPGDVIRGLADNGSWVVIKNVESHPEYREVLEATIREASDLVEAEEGGVIAIEGFIFVSAPNTTTPTHVDPEHNVLLHLAGTKSIHIGAYRDAGAAAAALETFHGAGERNLREAPVLPLSFDLTPGDGVYVPLHAPHYVTNGPTPSVSFSLTFTTVRTDKVAAMYKFNHQARRLGLQPSYPGASPWRDEVKQAMWRAPRAVARAVRGRRRA